MSVFAKLKWVFGLAVVFLLILATGRTNIQNFKKVQASIEEIYADRLVVKGLIFELSTLLHRKEIANVTGDVAFYELVNASINEQVAERLREFRATKLTAVEDSTLERFASNIERLKATEAELDLAAGIELAAEDSQRLADLMGSLKEDLQALSKIQLTEGRRQVMVGDQAVDDMDWVARVETYMLAFIALALIAVILSRPKQPKPV